MLNQNNKPLSEDSPSVQGHLSILQNVIERMAVNSSSAKTWCVTIVSAILVVVADKNKPNYALIALIPLLLFLALDVYYLAMEKGFRNSYKNFVEKLHNGTLMVDDLYSVKREERQFKLLFEAVMSFAVWWFYVVLGLMILLTKSYILH